MDRERGWGRPTALGILILVVAAAGLLLWGRAHVPRGPEASAARPARDRSARPAETGPSSRPGAQALPSGPQDSSSRGEEDDLGGLPDPAVAWSKVDLEAVRAAMPNNLYWRLSMPTTDAALVREREQIRAEWNRQYGKVLSGTATEQEVRDYYAHRQRLSADSVEFATYLLDRYRDVLPERDVGLLELARELHLARLEELPRNLSDALERREAQERARRAWLADQERFRGEGERPSE
jgi:hypothetical protein